MKNIISFALMVFAVLLLCSGCASMPNYDVRIDSISSGQPTCQKYYLFPGKEGVSAGDLQFQEFATYTHRALQQKGFVKTDIATDADIAVFLYYNISEPSEHQYSYSTPIYGQTGVSSSQTYGSLYSYGNNATYSGTTTYTPTYGVVGSCQHSGAYITFTRYISLNALDLAAYRKSEEEKQVWKTDIFSTGSSGDLRKVFPVMLAASVPYIGENTGEKIKVTLYENDQRVTAIKELPVLETATIHE
jgi:hypothetical protein